MRRFLLVLAVLMVPAMSRADDPPPFEWKDGDRVVLIGDALIEREQKYGYLETLITAQNPDKAITFRNLGWSGDNVRGIARAGFGTPEEGYRHLTEHVLALKPTVILVGYGMTDSFEGEAGLPKFQERMNRLLDAIAPTDARLVILSPIDHEDLGRPFPDPTRHNKSLGLYSNALRDIARQRGARFIGLAGIVQRDSVRGDREPLVNPRTEDGIHLNEWGYRLLGMTVTRALGRVVREAPPTIAEKSSTPRGLEFTMTYRHLPPPPIPGTKVRIWPLSLGSLPLFDEGLPDGVYRLSIDGKLAARADARQWKEEIVACLHSPDLEQTERLRQAIIEKNRLYFYRWRPQNVTYLYGFRKHEQGQNAREIPLFDPLVEEKEKEIARLRVPVSHVYELVREGEESK